MSYGLARGIELIEGCVRPCWTGPGPLEACLGFAWRLTLGWRPEKAPHVRIAFLTIHSLPAYHGATISPISPPRSVLSPEQQLASRILSTSESTLSLSLKFSPHLDTYFALFSLTQLLKSLLSVTVLIYLGIAELGISHVV